MDAEGLQRCVVRVCWKSFRNSRERIHNEVWHSRLTVKPAKGPLEAGQESRPGEALCTAPLFFCQERALGMNSVVYKSQFLPCWMIKHLLSAR